VGEAFPELLWRKTKPSLELSRAPQSLSRGNQELSRASLEPHRAIPIAQAQSLLKQSWLFSTVLPGARRSFLNPPQNLSRAWGDLVLEVSMSFSGLILE